VLVFDAGWFDDNDDDPTEHHDGDSAAIAPTGESNARSESDDNRRRLPRIGRRDIYIVDAARAASRNPASAKPPHDHLIDRPHACGRPRQRSITDAMDLIRRASRMLAAKGGGGGGGSPQLPFRHDDDEKAHFAPRRRGANGRLGSRLDFFRRPLRLRGNSSVSVPLGVLILFPCLVVVLIMMLFIRHPSSPGMMFMPTGASPGIR
jgi:hypothetical protein